MNIQVFSEREIKDFKTNKEYAIISILSPGSKKLNLYMPSNCLGICSLQFHDVDDIFISNFSAWCSERKITPFTEKNAKNILSFVNIVKNYIEILCVHCEAGISRSAGVAGALSKIYNGDDSYYFKNYIPNIYVYRVLLQIYERNIND